MLVGDIEQMQPVEVRLAPRVRLYFIEDKPLHIGARPGPLFLAVDGTFKRLPVFGEREGGLAIDRASVCFDKDAIHVVEGGAEVVYRIAEHRWRMARESGSDGLPGTHWPPTLVGLTSEELCVCTHVLPEDTFKLVKVLFSPFAFEQWAVERRPRRSDKHGEP